MQGFAGHNIRDISPTIAAKDSQVPLVWAEGDHLFRNVNVRTAPYRRVPSLRVPLSYQYVYITPICDRQKPAAARKRGVPYVAPVINNRLLRTATDVKNVDGCL